MVEKKIDLTKNTIVELDGDEMTRVLWKLVKDQLLFPYIDMKLDYYDLGLVKRNETNDQITVDSANAIKKHMVGVKCATITPNKARIQEYDLKEEWKSPNGTLRAMLDGTIFRGPILVNNIPPNVRTWKKPIYIGRHAYGDVYKNVEMKAPGPGKAELLFTPEEGEPIRKTIFDFTGPGILQSMHNIDASIRSFATATFMYGLDKKLPVWMSTKDTISKTYDARFKDLFQEEFDANWKDKYDKAGLEYFYTLIDDAVARIIKGKGGVLWALKNYDGDVMSDMLGSAFGSLAMMTSVLVSPHGYFEYEAAHGTVQKHYYKYKKGEKTSTNPMALIFAWTGAIRKRAELDNVPEAVKFANALEAASIETVEDGIMTGDLLLIIQPDPRNKKVDSWQFLDAIRERLDKKMAGVL